MVGVELPSYCSFEVASLNASTIQIMVVFNFPSDSCLRSLDYDFSGDSYIRLIHLGHSIYQITFKFDAS